MPISHLNRGGQLEIDNVRNVKLDWVLQLTPIANVIHAMHVEKQGIVCALLVDSGATVRVIGMPLILVDSIPVECEANK